MLQLTMRRTEDNSEKAVDIVYKNIKLANNRSRKERRSTFEIGALYRMDGFERAADFNEHNAHFRRLNRDYIIRV